MHSEWDALFDGMIDEDNLLPLSTSTGNDIHLVQSSTLVVKRELDNSSDQPLKKHKSAATTLPVHNMQPVPQFKAPQTPQLQQHQQRPPHAFTPYQPMMNMTMQQNPYSPYTPFHPQMQMHAQPHMQMQGTPQHATNILPPISNAFVHPSEQRPQQPPQLQQQQLKKPKKEDGEDSTMNVESMLDCTSYGGVDVNYENDNLKSLAALFPQTKQPALVKEPANFLNQKVLLVMIKKAAIDFGITAVDKDVLEYITLAAKEHCSQLMEKMIVTAKHRTLQLHTSLLSRDKHLLFTTNQAAPIDIHVVVKSDIKRTLAALEQEEIAEDKQLRIDRGEQVIDSVFDGGKKGGAINMSGQFSKKAKAVAMPDAMKSKMVNQTALKAAGGVLKSWMIPGASSTSANGAVAGSKKKAEVVQKPYAIPMGQLRNTQVRLGRPMTLKESKRITLRDALHCLEGDAVLRKSTLLSKWYAKIK